MDVYEQLWDKNKDIAEKILNLPFFQEMQRGDLQADQYVTFMLQDIHLVAYYLDSLKSHIQLVTKPDIKALFEEKSATYQAFVDENLKKFHLKDAQDILPILDLLKDLFFRPDDEDLLLFLIRLLARERLWLWLADQLKEDEGNAYFTWKKENMTKWTPEEDYKKVINENLTTPSKIERCIDKFGETMQREYDSLVAPWAFGPLGHNFVTVCYPTVCCPSDPPQLIQD